MNTLLQEDYFSINAVSNSDLTKLKNEMLGVRIIDNQQAFYFGTLFDNMLTEHDNISFYEKKLNGKSVNKSLWEQSMAMRKALLEDEQVRFLLKDKNSEFQKVFVKEREFEYRNLKYVLNTKCKFDIFSPITSVDLKTTVAKSQKEFENACDIFDYDRQVAWYMDISGIDYMGIVGISKKNNKIFKLFIDRNSSLYRQGYKKYMYLSLKYYLLYGN